METRYRKRQRQDPDCERVHYRSVQDLLKDCETDKYKDLSATVVQKIVNGIPSLDKLLDFDVTRGANVLFLFGMEIEGSDQKSHKVFRLGTTKLYSFKFRHYKSKYELEDKVREIARAYDCLKFGVIGWIKSDTFPLDAAERYMVTNQSENLIDDPTILKKSKLVRATPTSLKRVANDFKQVVKQFGGEFAVASKFSLVDIPYQKYEHPVEEEEDDFVEDQKDKDFIVNDEESSDDDEEIFEELTDEDSELD